MPTVSVCIPVFNGEASLGRAIQSALSQTRKPEEIVVCDDGSADASALVAEGLGARVIRQENKGVAAARNLMLREAKGELVALLDHDDEWLPEKLEEQLAALEGSGAALTHSDCEYVYDSGVIRPRELRLKERANAFDHILPDNRIITSSAVFGREAMLEAGGFAEGLSRCSDWHGWFQLAAGNRFLHLPKLHVRYFVRSDSLANSGLKFHSEKKRLLEEFVLPDFERIFAGVPEGQRARYRRMIEIQVGIAASTVARCLEKEGRKGEAKPFHREAMRRAPSVPRVWTRWLRSLLG